jgi:hypothetical protein
MELLGKSKTFFLTVITILALSAFATANTCTDAYFNTQAHAVFDQESNLRLDSIFYSQSPAGWKGKKYFYNESLIEKVMVDFKQDPTHRAYWFFYRDTNETVINQKDFYEYIDSTYKKQDTLFHHLKTYYHGEYEYTQIIRIAKFYYSLQIINSTPSEFSEKFVKHDTIVEIRNFNYSSDSSLVTKAFYIADLNDDYKCNKFDEQQNLIYTFTYIPNENGFSLKQDDGENYIETFVINEDKITTSLRKSLKPIKFVPKARYFDLLGRFKFTK